MKLPGALGTLPQSRRVQWWVSFALFTLLIAAWSFSNPLLGGVDEPDHVIRSASVARGELIGPTGPGQPDSVRFVKVPHRLVRSRLVPACYVFHRDVTAACEQSLNKGPDGMTRTPLTNARLPPTPYGILGLPSLVNHLSAGVYLMRLLGAALCGALFASALLSLRETPVPWLAVSGLAFALTPMVLYTASIVNPSNLEIAGGVALWASGVVLVRKACAGVVDGRVVTRTAVAAGVLVLARPLGMLWLGIAVVVLLVASTGSALRLLLRSRVAQVWAGIVGACIAFELAWVTFYDSLGSKVPPGPSADGLSNFEVLKVTLGGTYRHFREMIGVFGWVDTPAPALTIVLWTGVLGALVGLGIGLARRRQATAIVALFALIIAVPAVLELIEARRFGFGWQGRYTLPLAVGLPILGGFALAETRVRVLQRGRLTVVFGTAFVVAHFLAFWQNLRRYTVGYDGPLAFWREANWSPPLPSMFLLVAYGLLLVAVALWLWSTWATATSALPEHAEVTTHAREDQLPGLEYTRSG